MSFFKLDASGLSDLTRRLDSAATAMQDEKALREDMRAAVAPITASARSIVRRRSGKTADDIETRDAPSVAGTVVLHIGGSAGKSGRRHIMRFLEKGVRRSKKGIIKFPFLGPAYANDGGAWVGRLMARVGSRLRAGLGR